jgi:hypothetical protein
MFTVFRCQGCQASLSVSLRCAEWQLPQRIPGREHYTYGPSTVPRGCFMLDPTPFGVPYGGADTEGWVTAVINPLDGVLLRPHVDPARRVGCCRPDGSAGPNLMCSCCGAEVGIEVSDCWTEFDVRLLLPGVVQDTSDPTGQGS